MKIYKNMIKTILITSVFIFISASINCARAATVTALDITGGSLEILNTTGTSALLTYGLTPGTTGKIITGSYQGQGQIVSAITAVDDLGTPVEQLSPYTAPSGGIYAGPFPAPSGYTTGDVLVMDMSSWFVQSTTLGIGGSVTSINQEPNSNGGFTFGSLSGNSFTMTWDANPYIQVGSVSGPTRWTLSGTVETVNTVPLPAAGWLLASGLCLAGLLGRWSPRKHPVS